MKLAVVGSGYVGLVSGACLADFGCTVTCVDRDAGKIARLQQGEIPIYEPGLAALVAANMGAGRLRFTTGLGPAVADADAVIIAVGTPEGADGLPDLTYAEGAAREIAAHLAGYTVIINKSTVPVGFGARVAAIVRAENPAADVDVCSNPEFLREGSAIGDFMRPDRVVIGTASDRAAAVLRELYRPLTDRGVPLVFGSRETAELTKYAGNAFLATKITFINQIADLCERVGADVAAVAQGIGLDSRIGRKFLQAGPGYGGSCFPKDTTALAATGRKHGAPQGIVEAVITGNAQRKDGMAQRILAALGDQPHGKTVGILGLTFKADTDDMRDAVSLAIVPALQAAGVRVQAYDPAGMAAARPLLGAVAYMDDAYAAAADADALVILTEWHDFRALDLTKLKGLLRGPVLLDLRNIFDPAAARAAGFDYRSIGRP